MSISLLHTLPTTCSRSTLSLKEKFLKIFSCASCQNVMQVSPFKRLNGPSPIFGERPFKRLNGDNPMFGIGPFKRLNEILMFLPFQRWNEAINSFSFKRLNGTIPNVGNVSFGHTNGKFSKDESVSRRFLHRAHFWMIGSQYNMVQGLHVIPTLA